MGLIKHLQRSPGIGWITKELSIAGFHYNANDTKFILEVLYLMDKYGLSSGYFDVIKKLHISHPISPLEDPLYNSEYIVHEDNVWQSNRLGSLFSRDRGYSWYDINRTSWKIKFFRFINKFIKVNSNKLLYFVQFPYDPNNDNKV